MQPNRIPNPKPFFSLLAAIILLLTINITAFSAFNGSWQSDLYLTTQTNPLTLSSKLNLNYSTGGVSYSSSSTFSQDSFKTQDFGVDFTLGLLEVDSTLSFQPQAKRLDYWLTGADFSLGGLGIGNNFLLEYLDQEEGHGAGYELTLSGVLPAGPKMYVTNRFGMEENEAEWLGVEEGSGYTIVTASNQVETYGASQFQYVSTTIELTELGFACCSFDSTTRFSEEKGFDYSVFEFELNAKGLPLKLDGKLQFTTQTKSVELDPRIEMDWACFEVYTDLTTADDEDLLGNNSTKVDTIGGLQIEGFGISGVKLGHITFSSLTALSGNLNRLTDKEDLDLRATDYVLDPDPIYSGLYTETAYDEVISVEKSGEEYGLTFGADIYFDMTGSSSLFDTALFTGNGEYHFTEQFKASAGVALKPERIEKIRLGFDYYF